MQRVRNTFIFSARFPNSGGSFRHSALLPRPRQIGSMMLLLSLMFGSNIPLRAQAVGSAGTIQGVVVDPNGAVIAGAAVTIENAVTGYKRTVNTDESGTFRFDNVPPNNYQLSVS